MSRGLATRVSLHCLAAALLAGLALSVAPSAPAVADEYPVVRQPRYRMPSPRVRAPVRHVRHVRSTVRSRYIPVYYTTCGGCAPMAVPTYYVSRPYVPRYYAAGCGSCLRSTALPYYWAVRTAWYRSAYGYYRY
jgi:hypothetical protein